MSEPDDLEQRWRRGFDQPRRRRNPYQRRRDLRWVAAIALVVCLLLGILAALTQRGNGQGLRPPDAPLTPATSSLLPPPTAEQNAALAVVVYNENDPLSLDLAHFYAEKRGIPEDRLVALKCSTEEEISREEYDRDLAEPLRRAFDEHHWWSRAPDRAPTGPDDHTPGSTVFSNRIRYLVLTRGMPLKIRPHAGPYPGDQVQPGLPSPIRERNDAAVDSELATLGMFTHQISGIVPNPYFRAYSRIAEANLPSLLLVGRLDGPSATTVRRMIEDSLFAENNGLWGRAYVDARGLPPGNELSVGDTWFDRAATDSAQRALPTVYDRQPAMFPLHYPMTEAALYLGWYAQDPAGPFTRPDFSFVRGAVAYHLHSFSAVSLRDPSHYWVAPLLAKGAAASLGCVYEPYLGLTPRVDVLNARLLDGFTLGEAAYMASPGLSWMTTVVGDPLYRPGRVWQAVDFGARDADLPPSRGPVETEGRAYLRGVKTWRLRGAKEGAAELERSARAARSGRIYEGLGLLQTAAGEAGKARAAFEQAGRFYTEPLDQARVTLHIARALTGAGQKVQALELLRKAVLARPANSPAAEALREMEMELAPPPTAAH